MRHPRETVVEGHGSDTRLGLQPQPQLFVPLPVACGELLLGELRPRTELVFPVHLHPGGSVSNAVEGNHDAPLLQRRRATEQQLRTLVEACFKGAAGNR